MKRILIHRLNITNLLGTVLLTLAIAGSVRAASAPVQTKISYTESYADKAGVCTFDRDAVDPEDPTAAWSCDSPGFSDSFTISATVAGVFSNLTADTEFTLSLGAFTTTHTLADSTAHYVPGRTTSATFVDPGEDANGKAVVLDTVKLKWTAKLLTVTITGKATMDYGTAIAADTYDGYDSGKLSGDTLTGEIIFNDTDVTFDSVAITGTVRTHDVSTKDGSGATLSTISLKGSGQ